MTPPILEGANLRLEPLTLGHLPQLETVAFDPRIWRYMLQDVKTPEDLCGWVDAALALPKSIPWVTVLKREKRVIGSTRFLDLDLRHRNVELGHTWLHPDYHRTGLNREAKLLQLTYGFEDLKLNRIAFKTHHENVQSQTAIRALGAVYEGTFRNHYVMPDGSMRHSVWFSITKEDWPEVKARLQGRSLGDDRK
jgi:RimJ/RimL family protein N-acetyltransferase